MTEAKRPAWVKWVVLGCSGLIVVAGLATWGIVWLIRAGLAQTDSYKDAMAAVRASPAAVAALGEPIEAGMFVSGKVNVTGPTGEAELGIPVHGASGKGTIYLVATKHAGRWEYSLLELEVEGRPERIDLLPLPAKE